MKISRKELWAAHISESIFALVTGSLLGWAYYCQPLPWLVVGIVMTLLLKTSMEVRRLAEYQGTPLIPLDREESDDTDTT
jgi:hypothetical protein